MKYIRMSQTLRASCNRLYTLLVFFAYPSISSMLSSLYHFLQKTIHTTVTWQIMRDFLKYIKLFCNRLYMLLVFFLYPSISSMLSSLYHFLQKTIHTTVIWQIMRDFLKYIKFRFRMNIGPQRARKYLILLKY